MNVVRPDSVNRAEWWLAIALFVALAALRLHAIGADPPSDLQWHFIGDEGNWTHNARQQLLLGRWIVDEMNVPLFGAPLYTLTLWLWYPIVGIGLAQTRLVAALAGLGTCGLVYAVVRREFSARTALVATTLLGVDYFMLSHNRVAFVESFQLLFVTACALAAALSIRRPALGLAAGVLFVASLGAKLSATATVPGLAAFFGLEILAPSREPDARSRAVKAAAFFAAGAALAAGAVVVAFVLPNLAAATEFWHRFADTAATGNPLSNFGLLGLDAERHESSHTRLNGFFRQSWPLLAIVAVMAAGALTRSARRHWRHPLVTVCACWAIGALAALGTQNRGQDRRYLLLVPPLAILAAVGLRRGLRLPARTDGLALARWRPFAFGALVGGFVGAFVRPLLLPSAAAALSDLRIGEHRGASEAFAALAVWTAFTLAGAALGPLLVRLLPARPLRVPAALVVGAFVLFHLARFAGPALAPTYTIRDASLDLARRTADWPAERRVAVGFAADTLALPSSLWAFEVRDWDWAHDRSNLDGWTRFAPWISIGDPPPVPGYVRVEDLLLARGPRGGPRFLLTVWVRQEAVSAFGAVPQREGGGGRGATGADGSGLR